jgi:hypothetical protein
MSRRPARFTQADVTRAIRAAKAGGAGDVLIMPDGSIKIAVVPSAVTNTAPMTDYERLDQELAEFEAFHGHSYP